MNTKQGTWDAASDAAKEVFGSAAPKPRAGEHTKGPWRTHDALVFFPDNAGGFSLQNCPSPKANARRIVACVNALEGVSTEDIEARNVPQAWGAMVEAITDAAEVMNYLATRHSSIEAMTKRGENCRELEARFRALLAKHGR